MSDFIKRVKSNGAKVKVIRLDLNRVAVIIDTKFVTTFLNSNAYTLNDLRVRAVYEFVPQL